MDALTHWFMDSSSIPFFTASLSHWFLDSSIHDLIHSLIHWNWLAHCFTESLIRWIVNSLIRWRIDPLICPFIDSWINLFIVSSGALIQLAFHSHVNHRAHIRWCAYQLQQFIASASQKNPFKTFFFRNFRPGIGRLLPGKHIKESHLPPTYREWRERISNKAAILDLSNLDETKH